MQKIVSENVNGTKAIYFKSLNRPFTILGVERSLFYLLVGLCLPIAYSARLSLVMDIVAIGVFLLLHTLGILATRVDNQLLAIYRRHIHYAKVYTAHPGINAHVPLLKPSVPFYQGQSGWV